jgi:hypothetical protein
MVTWYGAEAQGEIYRDSDSLIIEFRKVLSPFQSVRKEVRLPFSQILSLSCQTDGMDDWSPYLPKKHWKHWKRARGKTHIVIKAIRPSDLDLLPAGSSGSGRLPIHWADQQAARELVDSVVQASPRQVQSGRPHSGAKAETPSGATGVYPQILAPAISLLVATLAVLAWSVFRAIELGQEIHETRAWSWQYIWTASGILAALTGAGFLIPGAVQMMRLRSYAFAVVVAIIATLPWPPLWAHMPFGMWALVILFQPEVRAAFRSARRDTPLAVHSPNSPPPTMPFVGPLRSFARSFGRYFMSGFSGPVDEPPSPSEQGNIRNGHGSKPEMRE